MHNFLFSCCQADGDCASIFNQKTGTECSYEAFVTANQNSQCHIPADSNTKFRTDNCYVCVRCNVLTAVNIKGPVFSDATPYSLVPVYYSARSHILQDRTLIQIFVCHCTSKSGIQSKNSFSFQWNEGTNFQDRKKL